MAKRFWNRWISLCGVGLGWAWLCGCGTANKVDKLTSSSGSRDTSEDTLGLTSRQLAQGVEEPWFLESKNKAGPSSYRPEKFDVALKAFRRVKVKSLDEFCSGTLVYEPVGSGKTADIFLVTARHCLHSVNPLGLSSAQPTPKPTPQQVVIANTRSSIAGVSLNQRNQGWRGNTPPTVSQNLPTADFQESDPPNLQIFTRALRKDPLNAALARPRIFKVNTGKWNDLGVKPYERLRNSDVVRVRVGEKIDINAAKLLALPVCQIGQSYPPGLSEPLGNAALRVRVLLGVGQDNRLVTHRLIGTIAGRKAQIGRYGFEPNVLDFLERTSFVGEKNDERRAFPTQSSISDTQSLAHRFAYSAYGRAHVTASDSGSPVITARQSYSKMKRFNRHRKVTDLEHYVVEKFECVSDILVREFWSNEVSGSEIQSEGSMIFVSITDSKENWE